MSGGKVIAIARKAKPSSLTARVDALEIEVEAIKATTDAALTLAHQAAQNTGEILAIIKHGKTATAFIRRHGPRLAAAGIGYAIAAGWINKAMGDAARTIFGL